MDDLKVTVSITRRVTVRVSRRATTMRVNATAGVHALC